MSGPLLAAEFFFAGPVRIVALEDAVAVAIEAEGNAVSGEQSLQTAEVTYGIFRFQLKVCGDHAAGGVILKADQGEARTATFQPIVTAGIGLQHHAKARPT